MLNYYLQKLNSMISFKAYFYWLLLLGLPLISSSYLSCSSAAFSNFNLLPIEQDVELGKEVEKEIAADPKTYPILPENGNEQIYQYVRGIATKIINSGQVQYKNKFAWKVRIVNDSKTLNAFCAPGGYIYVYTGLIKFLDTEDQLAGVLGHEIAHADLRHSTRQLTKIMGVSLVGEALLGQKQETIKQITTTLIALSFSREHETESDMASVRYLCGTEYNAAGSAGFFRKMAGQSNPPEFLSTHPNPVNRVKKIDQEKVRLNCRGTQTYDAKYAQMKKLI
jgi:predicted Zn-dependent protease